MSELSYKERLKVQLMRNRELGLEPSSQKAIAEKFGLSRVYVGTVIENHQHGPKADEWRKKFAAYAGMEEGWEVDSELIKLRLQLIKEVLERALKTKSLIKKLILVKLYELLNR